MKHSIENLTNELISTATATGESLVDLGAATLSATLHTTELTAKAAFLTVDTADYGLKVVIAEMPSDAEDLMKRASDLIDSIMEEVEHEESK